MESVQEMARHHAKIGTALESMQRIIDEQQQSVQHRIQNQGVRMPGDYEDEMSMYGDDMKNHGYSSEGKKRRGVGLRHHH